MFSITDFVTDDELDELPSDSREAFRSLLVIAQKKLSAIVSSYSEQEESGYESIREARHTFMNMVLAAAKQFDISPICELELPRFEGFGNAEYRTFQRDLDHYLMQFMLLSRTRARRDSIFVTPELRETIKTHLHHLREAVSNSELSETRKAELLKHLDDFEGELDKRRLSLIAVALLATTLASAPGGVASSVDLFQRVFSKVWLAVADAKANDDRVSTRSVTEETVRAITPPRIDLPTRPAEKSEDEIPF